MEIEIGCSTWIKEDDETVLELLQASDRPLTVEELCQATGLPAHRVEHTLRMLKKQIAMREGRKKLFQEN